MSLVIVLPQCNDKEAEAPWGKNPLNITRASFMDIWLTWFKSEGPYGLMFFCHSDFVLKVKSYGKMEQWSMWVNRIDTYNMCSKMATTPWCPILTEPWLSKEYDQAPLQEPQLLVCTRTVQTVAHPQTTAHALPHRLHLPQTSPTSPSPIPSPTDNITSF